MCGLRLLSERRTISPLSSSSVDKLILDEIGCELHVCLYEPILFLYLLLSDTWKITGSLVHRFNLSAEY